jgi:haloalkane dehalogenase
MRTSLAASGLTGQAHTVRIDFTPDPSLYPFRSRWFNSYCGQVHYIDEGTGPPILFCHDNPTWSFLYRKVITALRGSFRCIAVDYPGFGLSERPEGYGYTAEEHARCVGELVDHLQLDGLITMGHDWGGPVSLAVATARPERVRGVILGDTWFWPADLRMTAFSKVMTTSRMQRQILEKDLFVEWIMSLGMAHRLTSAEMDHYRKVQPSPSARMGVAEVPPQLLAAHHLLQRLASDVPAMLGDKRALLVWGKRTSRSGPLTFCPECSPLLPVVRGGAIAMVSHPRDRRLAR